MKIVADSSTFLAVVLAERERSCILKSTRGAAVLAPEILPYEIGNALSAMVRRARLSADQALAAWRAFTKIPVRLMPCDIRAALELAANRKIYAYDAYFLHTARSSGCALLTLDRAMQGIATDLGIETLEIGK